ncbi:MAG: glycosyltransferase family 2 protein [Candidatus Pacebacteria bacterium]|nr:glycosyltransferase family 2 protein [Candidatus Paceibacterota bacterium]MDD5356609.1 glycosyltransferase family 2 protein [Candidatus Paceibacterota bacterium]
MEYIRTPYYTAGQAKDLTGKDFRIYRFFEILPGFLAWATLFGALLLSYLAPFYAALFIIVFNLYWVLKSAYLSLHLYQNWRHIRKSLGMDWEEMLAPLKYTRIVHLVILPFYKESYEIVETSIKSLLSARGNKKKMAVVLAVEARAGESAFQTAEKIRDLYGREFGYFLITIHPSGISGEMDGKGSNIAYAAEDARKKILDANEILYEDVLVSAFDIDTIAYPDYFLCLMWHFLTSEDRLHASYQPVPFYNNNMWDAPALSRIVATSGSFWQMIQQERPERLTTFSSHSIPFPTLQEIGYWQKNIVSEDSRIFWNAFLAHDGNYKAVPISYPLSMDANLAPSFWQTMKNVYKQQRRWSWGVENLPYILMGFVKNPRISLGRKLRITFIELERAWSLATNPILLFLFTWTPILLGGRVFNSTLLSYNLPVVSRNLTFLGILGILLSAIVSISLLPPPPKGSSKRGTLTMFAQWIFVPATLLVFGSIPALEAQTRLMLSGKFRLGYWVTPKHRKS